MLARLLTLPFGSVWRLRELCSHPSAVIHTLARGLYQYYQYENCSSIAWNAHFSREPTFPHGMKTIFVSGGAQIGRNCVIFQQVTIGSIALPDATMRGAPIIGDDVYIGAGAKIIGAVRIGNNVRIGANAVVHRDVPDNSIVVSGEQRVITREAAPDTRFYTYQNGWGYREDGRWIPVADFESRTRS